MKLKLSSVQEELKNKQLNPLLNTKKELTSATYVIVILNNEELVKISCQSKLEIQLKKSLIFSSISIFPFNDPGVAVAFEKKVRYFYENKITKRSEIHFTNLDEDDSEIKGLTPAS